MSEKVSNGNHHLIDKEEEETPMEILKEEEDPPEEDHLEEDHPVEDHLEEDHLQTMALNTNLMTEEALDSR